MSTITYVSNKAGVSLKSFLDGLSLRNLLCVYNDIQTMAGGKVLKAFKDKPTALERVEKTFLVDKHEIALDVAGNATVRERAAAPPPAAPGEKPTRSSRPGRASQYPDSHVVTVLVEKYDGREGTKSADRFGKLRTGMTVGEYVVAVATIGGKLDKKLARRARRMVVKSVAKKRISVGPAK